MNYEIGKTIGRNQQKKAELIFKNATNIVAYTLNIFSLKLLGEIWSHNKLIKGWKLSIIRIKKIMKEKNRSVSFLQRRTGISWYSLDLIVNELKSPTIEQVKKIAKALEVSISEILVEIIYD